VVVLHRVTGQALPQQLADAGVQLAHKWRGHSFHPVEMQANHRFEYEEDALDLVEPPRAADIGNRSVQLAEHLRDRLMVNPQRLTRPLGVGNAVERWVDDFLLGLDMGDQIVVEETEDGINSVTQHERDRVLRVVGNGSHVIEVLAHDGVFSGNELLDRRIRRVP
jgi:hypothetical protein